MLFASISVCSVLHMMLEKGWHCRVMIGFCQVRHVATLKSFLFITHVMHFHVSLCKLELRPLQLCGGRGRLIERNCAAETNRFLKVWQQHMLQQWYTGKCNF